MTETGNVAETVIMTRTETTNASGTSVATTEVVTAGKSALHPTTLARHTMATVLVLVSALDLLPVSHLDAAPLMVVKEDFEEAVALAVCTVTT